MKVLLAKKKLFYATLSLNVGVRMEVKDNIDDHFEISMFMASFEYWCKGLFYVASFEIYCFIVVDLLD